MMKKTRSIFLAIAWMAGVGLLPVTLSLGTPGEAHAAAPSTPEDVTDRFMMETCNGFSSEGSNPYFVLEPGFQLVLQGTEGKETVHLTITVLNETKTFSGLDIGGGVVTDVVTRVVQERELRDGVLAEISKNYFALCNRTNSAFYFGEDVDIYDRTGTTVVSHAGSWLAGLNGARAGIIMPGTLLVGAAYFQEVAPGVALDKAEIISLAETVATPAGTFENCLETFETSALDKKAKGTKFYAPGIGFVKDGDVKLTSHGTLP